MGKMREPRNLNEYVLAEHAARLLEAVVRDIREHAARTPLVKWSLSIGYWNPDWATKSGKRSAK